MDLYSFPPIALLLDGAYWLVSRLQEFVTPFAGEASAALALVILTVLIRTALIPVGRSQVKAEISRKRLAPMIAELQKKYKNRETLQRKTMELYQREGTSPLAGCLPLLLQIPVLSAIYGLFIKPTIHDRPNELLQATLGGLPLSHNLPTLLGGGDAWPRILIYVALLGFMIVIAELQRRYLAPPQAPTPTPPTPAPGAPAMPDLGGLMKAMRWMPYLTVVIAASVPLAAGIYLALTSTWTLAERLILRRVLGARAEREASGPAAVSA
ncbi:YidC/Oxa1 family membrane protein insertase [Mycetocola spongiae]|uniref:YidC/Oxa1 family membrane protein insertase n=1 Tax=Mycetocola spongiae TaxID=2859226 RepID=UPI001CF0EF7E|nr:YidC/Oxa1 family membrane protein insertase [Mycetocola spongiae]UCR89870.1 YidC/Oxa1 family membrane protein insertase [Mycetocola spongiae]